MPALLAGCGNNVGILHDLDEAREDLVLSRHRRLKDCGDGANGGGGRYRVGDITRVGEGGVKGRRCRGHDIFKVNALSVGRWLFVGGRHCR